MALIELVELPQGYATVAGDAYAKHFQALFDAVRKVEVDDLGNDRYHVTLKVPSSEKVRVLILRDWIYDLVMDPITKAPRYILEDTTQATDAKYTATLKLFDRTFNHCFPILVSEGLGVDFTNDPTKMAWNAVLMLSNR